MVICQYCGKSFNPSDGAWDDGDYMCGECIAAHIEKSERTLQQWQEQVKPSGGLRSEADRKERSLKSPNEAVSRTVRKH